MHSCCLLNVVAGLDYLSQPLKVPGPEMHCEINGMGEPLFLNRVEPTALYGYPVGLFLAKGLPIKQGLDILISEVVRGLGPL